MGRKVFGGFSQAVLAVWALLIIAPLIWTLLASFKSNGEIFGDALQLPGELRWDNWVRAWERASVGRYLLNTVVVVFFGVAGTMLLSSMAAYVLARFKFPGNRLIYFLFVSGMAFPVFLALVPLFFVVDGLGLLNTHVGLILVYIAYSLPFTVFFLTSFFRGLPDAVAEAAMIDGASYTRTFFQVMLPMAKPGMVSLTIFNVLGQWNQYLLPLVLLPGDKSNWVITQGIADISTIAGYEADWPALFAALSMTVLPVVVAYIFFQRHIQSGLTSGAVK
ncbi:MULTISPECIES: carbohydrate ABC transporter permease [Streptosporangium]|uniref:N-acetylglucosamine transport system permease protein n=1 Tax=Streptosporangium brasiliense TaxID=47480 RepID=A0ABT9R541_9ACTN|nr:carbohydrate ABC transporter permease [Streptosporangium brasiliense]MDP9864343.1 N-acetylglucosamine transport system permease protein [Streptosporangium brasiliense]